LTDWTMKTSQNVLKMSTVSTDTSRERRRRHWLMAATTIEWSSFLHSTNSLCFSSARRHENKTSQVRVLHRLRWKWNCSCVLSRLRNNSSKLYKTSLVLNKIMLKIHWFCFFVDIVHFFQLNVRTQATQTPNTTSSLIYIYFIKDDTSECQPPPDCKAGLILEHWNNFSIYLFKNLIIHIIRQ